MSKSRLHPNGSATERQLEYDNSSAQYLQTSVSGYNHTQRDRIYSVKHHFQPVTTQSTTNFDNRKRATSVFTKDPLQSQLGSRDNMRIILQSS